MVWPLKQPGSAKGVLAEVNYEDGVDNWWHFGRLAVTEEGDVGVDWNPESQRVVVSRDPAKQNQMRLRTYSLPDVPEKDRRVLRTVGLDLIRSAPRIPYNRTYEGARRVQRYAFAALVSIEILTIATLLSLPSDVLNGSASQAASIAAALWLAPVFLGPTAALAVYWRAASRTLVTVIDVRPINTYVGPSRDELVYLANSAKVPTPTYFLRLFGLTAREV